MPLHSSTAFVEFTSIAAKQEAIQCNITGTSKYVTVTPVPEARDIIWRNMHLSKVLVETRRAWLNAALFGGLIFWSFLVSVIRDYDDISDWFDGNELSPAMVAFLDFYVPALVVEGLVRCIGLLIRALCRWVRFKSFSDIDYYVLQWYFGYRLMTFAFLILGASVLEKFDEIEDDAVGLVKTISDNVVENATFFVSYVIVSRLLSRKEGVFRLGFSQLFVSQVSGGLQIFFRFSQVHNVLWHWYVHRITTDEALSQRRLEELRSRIKVRIVDRARAQRIPACRSNSVACLFHPRSFISTSSFHYSFSSSW